MSETLTESHTKRISEVIGKYFLRPGPSISVEGINKDNTLFIDCHGGTLEDVFLIPNDLKIVTYTRNNSYLLSDEVLEFYTKITKLKENNRTGAAQKNLLLLPKN